MCASSGVQLLQWASLINVISDSNLINMGSQFPDGIDTNSYTERKLSEEDGTDCASPSLLRKSPP